MSWCIRHTFDTTVLVSPRINPVSLCFKKHKAAVSEMCAQIFKITSPQHKQAVFTQKSKQSAKHLEALRQHANNTFTTEWHGTFAILFTNLVDEGNFFPE